MGARAGGWGQGRGPANTNTHRENPFNPLRFYMISLLCPINSFMTEAAIIYNPFHRFAGQIIGLVSIWGQERGHERVNYNQLCSWGKLVETTSHFLLTQTYKRLAHLQNTGILILECYQTPTPELLNSLYTETLHQP